jgi:hypothetical protein
VATNLSDIGFVIKSPADMETLARKCFENGRATRCEQGMYIRWEVAHGIELWAQLNPGEELIGLNPHFSGKTRASAGLMQRVTRSGFPMDGGFRCLGQPHGSDPIRGAFTFVFDCPDFLLHEKACVPAIQSVQLTGFAQQCLLFENEDDYRSHASKRGSQLAPDAFVPLGLLGKNREQLADPLASAMVNGRVLDAAEIVNPFTKASFYWAKVRNAVGELDLVADPELLPEPPRAGNVLQCSIWLSGRLVD